MKTAPDQAGEPTVAVENRRAAMNEALVPVLGFSQTLLRNPEVGDPLRREFLLRIAHGARRLAQLVNPSNPNERKPFHGNDTTH